MKRGIAGIDQLNISAGVGSLEAYSFGIGTLVSPQVGIPVNVLVIALPDDAPTVPSPSNCCQWIWLRQQLARSNNDNANVCHAPADYL